MFLEAKEKFTTDIWTHASEEAISIARNQIAPIGSLVGCLSSVGTAARSQIVALIQKGQFWCPEEVSISCLSLLRVKLAHKL